MICSFPPELLLVKLGLYACRPIHHSSVLSWIAYCASRTPTAAAGTSKSRLSNANACVANALKCNLVV